MLAASHLLDPATSLLVLRRLAQWRKLVRAKTLLSALSARSAVPVPFLYSLVLQCLVPLGPIRDIELVWSEVVKDPPHKPFNASDFVVHLARRSANAAEIEGVFRRVSSTRSGLTPRAYSALIGALCKGENPNPVLGRHVLREMEEKGFEADELTYIALFRSFCRIGNPLEADSILRILVERKKYKADVLIYGDFLYGLCKSGKLREARKLFDKMSKKDRSFTANTEVVPVLKPGRRVIFQLGSPHPVSEKMAFEAYFRALCGTGRVEEAERLLKDRVMQNTVPDVCVYASFVEALFDAGRVEDAMNFFEAHKNKRGIDGKGIAVALIMGLCNVGRAGEGLQLLYEIVDGRFFPTARVWNRIVERFCEEGRVHDAQNLFDELRRGKCGDFARPDSSTYELMIFGLLNKGDTTAAIALLDEMTKKKIRADVRLYSAIVRRLYEDGAIEESNKYLNRMIENGILASYSAWEGLVDSMMRSR
ncbi:pentatricopeptide repeat-containing protein At1g12775, mitochondrial-like [Ananas comosus]|uniref:Pentatricopeptide repeat-containing protein At1g12775, mitochondrial-like n=1 Tax=Ananas comosus TaxID=4615 RepID=A0A6P5G2F9_ANACO|nr:pentatricopeptide repeat-containing protein At1g12775, mitochondrial-like [Ananas comosus]